MRLPHLFLSALTALSSAQTFRNPVLWEDYPDLDVFRVGSVYYYSSSTFAYSPGAPLLKSYDLVNWEPITHSVPTLNFGAKYNLTSNTRAYVKGIWASTLRYYAKRDVFIWLGCVEGRTYIWTASGTNAAKNNGEVEASAWNWLPKGSLSVCYYDSGLLIDEQDDGSVRMYVAYGNPRISIAEIRMEEDGTFNEVSAGRVVYDPGQGITVEGARLYKKGKGEYVIFVTRPADQEIVLRSTGGIYGPYTSKMLVNRIQGPLSNAGYAHQGGMVDTEEGRWYYVAFLDAYPGGRIPVVAPMVWGGDGFPRVETDSGERWGVEYGMPVNTTRRVSVNLGTDEFKGGRLSEHWEWNHNPDGGKWRLEGSGGLVLQTVDVTGDLFAARNTLTRRIVGPKSSGTFRMDVSGMRDGDRAGAVLFRDRSAYVGVHKEGTTAKVVVVTGFSLTQSSWETSGRGSVVATGPTLGNATDVWFKMEADVTPAFGTSTERTVLFSYSVDGGKTFVRLGPAVPLANSWQYFTGYRFGVFNHATKTLGGEVKVKSFTLAKI
ncbi:hypothetical protein B0T14DRAFT_436030 [Immersiella caudata]|uniref:Beta-xylosidase C-terminal Concanavalin A-like domain-containing protein n=1 Tax=Immersiella caudata TaxID=314043 RepID=A0AA39WJT1_9PEZI|nr:hypothetical protein B0T14DRAFT_436030 [Immersiella caudata]